MKKQCAWWVVINKEWKILLTKKLGNTVEEAKNKLKELQQNNKLTILDIMLKWDCSLTKWKIQNWDKKLDTAKKEIEEEWWITSSELEKITKLWKFSKPRDYGSKEITIYLFKTLKNEDEINPTDEKHISWRFDLETALKIIKKSEEEFLKKNREKIEKNILKLKKEILKNNFTKKNQNTWQNK